MKIILQGFRDVLRWYWLLLTFQWHALLMDIIRSPEQHGDDRE